MAARGRLLSGRLLGVSGITSAYEICCLGSISGTVDAGGGCMDRSDDDFVCEAEEADVLVGAGAGDG